MLSIYFDIIRPLYNNAFVMLFLNLHEKNINNLYYELYF